MFGAKQPGCSSIHLNGCLESHVTLLHIHFFKKGSIADKMHDRRRHCPFWKELPNSWNGSDPEGKNPIVKGVQQS